METAEQLRLIKQLWSEGLSRGQVSERVGISPRRLDWLRETHCIQLPPRVKGTGGGASAERPPSPLEIRKRAAAIRADWTEADYADRAVGNRVLSDTALLQGRTTRGRTDNPIRPLPQ